ncbi:MAG: sortase [Oscillospiraceae bacterium]
MPKKAGIAIMAAGAVLIISALLLFVHNRQEDAQAGQEAESLLESVEAVIEAQAVRKPSPSPGVSPSPAPVDPTMPTVTIDGYDYIGYVEVPVLGLKLPVMAEWNYDRLKIAPCRQFGSTRTDDLVIAAHNFESHFGRLKELTGGETVIFTDMDGVVSTYSVTRLETLSPIPSKPCRTVGMTLSSTPAPRAARRASQSSATALTMREAPHYRYRRHNK